MALPEPYDAGSRRGDMPMSDASTTAPSTTALSPETVLAEMKKNGVSHIVWLPDSETNWLYLLMKSEPSLTLIQNTGLQYSGVSLRGWLLGMNVGAAMMVVYRGWAHHGKPTDTAATY